MSARHLPKTDRFGSCDAFCELRLCGQTRRTPAVRNSLRPDWNARLRFQVPAARLATALELDLYDSDLMRNEFIGRHVVSREYVEAVACRPKGWRATYDCQVMTLDLCGIEGDKNLPSWGFPSQFTEPTKVLMATTPGRRRWGEGRGGVPHPSKSRTRNFWILDPAY